ncbi:MAG: Sorting nexin mvp1 [Vezdaea aestivalis]|nr:MAG: Sorting nexin mvp1 [Vezdaea aestivalis]
MSLFGTSPDGASAPKPVDQSRSSLFDDEPTSVPASQSSLFADDSASPWTFNTSKREPKGIRSILASVDVPDSYIDLYDNLVKSGDKVGTGLSLTGVRKLLQRSNIAHGQQAQILDLVVPGGQESLNGVQRSEFNGLVALIGLAQEGDDVSLDGVDDRKTREGLPEPVFEGLESRLSSSPAKVADNPTESLNGASTAPSNNTRAAPRDRSSLAFSESDPWASPALHKGHKHSEQTPLMAADGSSAPGESRSAAPEDEQSGSAGGWGPYPGDSAADFSPAATRGFGDDSQAPGNPSGRSSRIGRVSPSVEEVVTITLLPEKEGMFMFQHRNYQVASARRGSKVVRRYSDFVWLLDCLHKRYPFRRIPLLPPKTIAVNGKHLSSDASFIEKRRRGLVRFTNGLIRHPVLGQEQLVTMFLTVPTELAVWRKQAAISVQEEFTGKPLPPQLEDSLPATLNETFDTVRTGVRRGAEIYINLCSLLERLAKRNEGIAADYLRLSLALQTLTDTTESTYAVDTNDVPLLNEGLNATAKHLTASQSLLEDESRAWDEGVLEDLKKQRDVLVSMRDLFDRRDRYARDNIPYLEKRIQTNETKLTNLKAKPEGSVKPSDIEKVEDAIIKDKQSIVAQHARGVFITECVRDELGYFQSSQYHISRLHQDWSQERVKYAELQADNWRGLSEEIEGMPLGE